MEEKENMEVEEDVVSKGTSEENTEDISNDVTKEVTKESEDAVDENEEAATEAVDEAKEAATEAATDKSEKKFCVKEKLLAMVSSLKGIYLYLAIAVAVLLAALIIILVLPANRSNRALKKADKAYAVMDYETAGVLYEKAFSIDEDNLEAYYGYLLTKSTTGDGLKESFLEVFENLETITVNHASSKVLLDIFLLAPEMLSEDYEKLIEVLEFASANVSEGAAFNNPLADAYFKYACEKEEDADTALSYFDKALELSDNAESMAGVISEFVIKEIGFRCALDEFDGARELLNKYGDVLNLDIEALNASIETAEELSETKKELFNGVYEAMEPYYTAYKDSFEEGFPNEEEPLFRAFLYDWSNMVQYDGSNAANIIALSDTAEAYLFTKDISASENVGCGLYPFGEKYTDEDGNEAVPYYFYFGEYKNGKRDGYGITFIRTDAMSFDVFEGIWSNDKPNGFGAYYNNNMYAYTSLAEMRMLTYGNYTDGLEDGEMTAIAVLNEHPDVYFKSTYTASAGVVAPLEGEPIEHGIVDPTPEGSLLVVKLGSTTDGYDYFVPLYVPEGNKLGLYGFND